MWKRIKESRPVQLSLASVAGGLLLLGTPGGAFAVAPSPDPAVVTAVQDGFTSSSTLIVTVVAVAAFALLVAIIAIKVGMKWLARTAQK